MKDNASVVETIHITRLDATMDSQTHAGSTGRGDVGSRTTVVYDEHNKAHPLRDSLDDTAVDSNAV